MTIETLSVEMTIETLSVEMTIETLSVERTIQSKGQYIYSVIPSEVADRVEESFILESEIKVQHIVKALHVEVLGIEAIVSLHALAVDKTSLLITAGLHCLVVCDVLEVEREAEVILTVDIP